MMSFALWLIAADKETADKWYRLFSRERLNISVLPDISAGSQIDAENWGLVFLEASPRALASPKDLKFFLNGRKNISAIIFSRPGKTPDQDISAFLENGADDFITSDIDERVLLSKTKAHIRRLLPNMNLARTTVASSDGDLEIDKSNRSVKLGLSSGKNKVLDGLTPKEFEILFVLLSNEEQVVSRKFLMEHIWCDKCGDVNFETIDKHVETLRKKLGTHGRNIRTVYGTGYAYRSKSREAA